MMSLPRFTRVVLAPVLSSLLLAALLPAAFAQAQTRRAVPRTADYILAIVNSELVTANELESRVAQVRAEAARTGARLPSDDELRSQLLDALIEERIQITYARDNGVRVDDIELERAVANIASQNQLTVQQLRDRLRVEGIDYVRFRNNIRDQIMMERNREREVQARIRITDSEIDDYLAQQRGSGATTQFNLAQVLIQVPEGATEEVVAQRKAVADDALRRIQGGEPFGQVARELSSDANKDRGGEIGMRPGSRLPELFLTAVRDLKTGQVTQPIRSGAGFHILKVLERRDTGGNTVTQTRARHILLRPTQQMSAQQAAQRLNEFKRQILSGTKSFESIAREFSEDGSGPQGGDLGWVNPGAFVPEFEEAMNGLPIDGISDPVTSRFGLHLIQVTGRRDMQVDPKQLREQARAALRERKYETAHTEWMRELRSRAYIEMREAPQ